MGAQWDLGSLAALEGEGGGRIWIDCRNVHGNLGRKYVRKRRKLQLQLPEQRLVLFDFDRKVWWHFHDQSLLVQLVRYLRKVLKPTFWSRSHG